MGRDTISNSQDTKMKAEMPKSLAVIETAAESLAQASTSLNSDPYSKVTLSSIPSEHRQTSLTCLSVPHIWSTRPVWLFWLAVLLW